MRVIALAVAVVSVSCSSEQFDYITSDINVGTKYKKYKQSSDVRGLESGFKNNEVYRQ